ncbi:CRISPR-associated protein, Csm5 family [Caldanaerovirga acetigignens]|uniref:CRISPR system Cms protein Csm5 n=1 Tax=Caldanaerovirga acetigignens TaxID=447595 RepID=A0A1M7M816_9FIRM|nr:type III-A CRISPR-associated RAMP protein Csm5 [Caldanaerovirga acetigignens]SHM86420.1 CRISPR-associated protein, Csm5 family [Caldanaerovirga acetigignens]
MKGYEIEVISPLNIGNGIRKMSFEYVCREGRLKYIDIYKLLKDISRSKVLVDGVICGFRNGYVDWKALRINVDNYIKYILECVGTSAVKGEIVEFIKTAGKPYIPGSSIKGAVRSSITRGLYSSVKQVYTSAIDKESDPKRADDRAEENVFGKPHSSPFRFLLIGDTEPFDVEDMGIYEMKILNICNGRVKWYNRARNFDNPKDALSIFLEALKKRSKGKGFLSIDGRINDSFIISEGKIKRANDIKNFVSLIRKDINNYIEREIKFYEKFSMYDISNFYKQLKDLSNQLKDNEILIQIGFGSGFNSKTISSLFEGENRLKLKKFIKKFDSDVFPKTRRIIFKDGKPYTVPGWVKISFC